MGIAAARNAGRANGVKSKGDRREFITPLLLTQSGPGRVPQMHLTTWEWSTDALPEVSDPRERWKRDEVVIFNCSQTSGQVDLKY